VGVFLWTRRRRERIKALGPFLILISAVSWSTAGLFTRVVSTDIPTTLFWRSLFGGVCVLALYMWLNRNNKALSVFSFRKGEVVIALLSTAGMVCFISAFFFTSIANVSFVYGVMPVVTYGLSVLVLKDRVRVLATMCCALSAAGMAVITLGNSQLGDYLGISLALCMTFFMACLTVATKFYLSASGIKATYLSAFIGAFIMLPFASFESVSTHDYLWLGLYGAVNVGLGFGVYLLGVVRVKALSAALIGLFEIPLAPVWAWLLFDESNHWSTFLGGGIILLSAVIYLLKSNQRQLANHR